MNEKVNIKAVKYLATVEKALTNFTWGDLPITITKSDARSILEMVKNYVSDARFYLEKHDSTTALSSISYAEGLLDAMKHLRIAKFSWQIQCKKR